MSLFASVASLHTPVGWLVVTCEDGAIVSVSFSDEAKQEGTPDEVLIEALRQLEAYAEGNLQVFTVPVRPKGTAFQLKVWNRLQQIPFGRTVSYRDIARAIGDEKSVRAVGLANGQNPVAVIIPCHRVIGVDGSLTGYAGGLPRKMWLLNHEKGAFQTEMFEAQSTSNQPADGIE